MKNSNFQNWSIEKGDYKRDETSTWTFQKKIIRKRRIKKTALIILYTISISVISYMIFS
ncbi:MAG TPA: hypothetical protein PLZ15_00100 [Melioribacteraceae bacterium]|nr:hypothetical protein [Melioribacteraceae bacterium]